MVRIYLIYADVKSKILVVEVVHAYPQIVARASWHASCLTSLTAIAIKEVAGTFDLPFTATRTLFTTCQLSSASDQAGMSCHEETYGDAVSFSRLGIPSRRSGLITLIAINVRPRVTTTGDWSLLRHGFVSAAVVAVSSDYCAISTGHNLVLSTLGPNRSDVGDSSSVLA